jgi:hydrogenase maturation protein HypF
MSFEGESGMKMEEYYNDSIREYYPFIIEKKEINILPIIREIVKEDDRYIVISKFFNTVVEIIYIIYKKYNLQMILSGGVFQNRVLLQLILDKIPTATISNKIPPNDGGIALGQVVSTLFIKKD